MLATYAHLVAHDANDAVLKMYGIQKSSPNRPEVQRCGMCEKANTIGASFCSYCGYALNSAGLNEISRRLAISGEYVARLLERPIVQDELRRMLASESQTGRASTRQQCAPAELPTLEAPIRRRDAA